MALIFHKIFIFIEYTRFYILVFNSRGKNMKKTLAAVLAAGALFIGGIGSVDAANWYTVGTDSNGITWSIDNDSVKKDDKKATLDIKAMDYEGYYYIVTEEFNHKKREVKDVKVTLYNPQGYVVKEEQPNKSTRKVEQGTPAYAVYTLIWGDK